MKRFQKFTLRAMVGAAVGCVALLIVPCSSLAQETAPAAPAPTSSSVDDLLFRYQAEAEELSKPIAELQVFYEKKLKDLAEVQKGAGDLDAFLKTNEEVAQFRTADSVVTDAGPELLRLREIYSAALVERENGIKKAVGDLRLKYAAAFRELVGALTRASQIDAAKRAREMQLEFEDPFLGKAPVLVSAPTSPTSGEGMLRVWGKQRSGSSLIPVTEPSANEAKGVSRVEFDGFKGFWHAISDDGSLITSGWPDDIIQPRGKVRGVIDLAGGNSGGAAVTAEGEVVYFGYENGLETLRIPDLGDEVQEFEMGNGWSIALRKDGTAVFGGLRTTMPQLFNPKPEELQNVRFIRAGLGAAFAQRNDGSAIGWSFVEPSAPVVLPEGARVKDARLTGFHGLILLEDGTVMPFGQLPYPIPPDLGKVLAVRVTEGVYAVQKADETWFAWGDEYEGIIEKINSIGKAHDLAILTMQKQGVAALAWIE